MLKPRNSAAAIIRAAALLCLLLPAAHVQAQDGARQAAGNAPDNRSRGIQLLQNGQVREAIGFLRAAVAEQKDDSEAWYNLGLALYRSGDEKGARQALETTLKLKPEDARARSNLSYVLLALGKRSDAREQAERAIKLNQQSAEAHYVLGAIHFLTGKRDKALQEATTVLSIDPDFAPALLLKARSLIDAYAYTAYSAGSEKNESLKHQLEEAADSLERYLKLNPHGADEEMWRAQLEALRAYATIRDGKAASGVDNVYSTRDVTVRARILSRKEPEYPVRVREKGITGRVVLRAIFGADGRVRNILAVASPDSELTAVCIEAARQIRFIPAQKDGQPVSQFVQIEYNFNIY